MNDQRRRLIVLVMLAAYLIFVASLAAERRC